MESSKPWGRWRRFEEARAFVRKLGLVDQTEWYAYCRGDMANLVGTRPRDIPSNPSRIYRMEGWAGVRDWLDPPPLAAIEPGFLSFKRARAFARTLGLRTARDWSAWCAGRRRSRAPRPLNVPRDPDRMYPRVWRGWRDWLGVERRPQRDAKWLPFDEARRFARSIGLADNAEWRAYSRGRLQGAGRLPDNIPCNPENVYSKAGWLGYGDWLDTGRLGSQVTPTLPFEAARSFVRTLGLRNMDEFLDWTRGNRPDLPARPVGIPTMPHRSYRNSGWTSAGDFLGTGYVSNNLRPRRAWPEAREFARSLGLRSHTEWRAYCRGERPDLPPRPVDVPCSPDRVYDGLGWTRWGDFLGTGAIASRFRNWRSFAATRRFARSLGFTSVHGWQAWCRGGRPDLPPRPDDVPACPDSAYRNRGWIGWTDFLRGDRVAAARSRGVRRGPKSTG